MAEKKEIKGEIFCNLEHIVQLEPRRLSMGVRPSGNLHLGSFTTLLLSLYALSEVKAATLDLEVMDLDFDLQRGKVAQPYFNETIKDKETGEARLVGDELLLQLEEAIKVVEKLLGEKLRERIDLRKFSDVYRNPKMTETFANLILNPLSRYKIKHAIFDGKGKRTEVPLYPICPDCGMSGATQSRVIGDTQELETICFNPECEIDVYRVSLLDPCNYNIHYFIDPIRDTVKCKGHKAADLHIFGGDYGVLGGQSKVTKAERVRAIYNQATDSPPAIFVGPEITIGQLKMSKSTGIGVDWRNVSQLKKYADLVLTVIASVENDHPSRLDYLKIEERMSS